MNYEGLIPILGGIWTFLYAKGVLPRKPKNPERLALWRRKFGPMVTVLSPFIVFFGVLQLLGVFGGTASPAGRKKPGAMTTVYRQAAGTPDESGWFLAKSTGGGFTVLLPRQFNDATVTGKTASGGAVYTHAVGTTTEDGVKYTATCIEAPASRTLDAQSLEDMAARFEKKVTLASKRSLTWRGHPGIELRIADGATAATVRYYLVDQTLYTLMVEYPAAAEQRLAPDIGKFLDSLTIPEN